MPKLPRSTSSATSSMASGTIPSRPAKPHPDRLKIMHLFPDRPLGSRSWVDPGTAAGAERVDGLRGLGHGRGACGLHGAQVDVEQGLVLVALILILLAQADDLLQDLHVKALALGFREDLLLLLIQLLQLGVSCSMRSTNERMRSPAIPTGSVM